MSSSQQQRDYDNHVEAIRDYICSQCHSAILADHPENAAYRKCPICGFSKIKKVKKEEIVYVDKK